MLVFIGIPLLLLELAIGQFTSRGPATVFDRLCPLFNGLGFAMITVSAMVVIYYSAIISWCILYLFKSFTTELPWVRCHAKWATSLCYSYKDASSCKTSNGSLYHGTTCYNNSMVELLNIKTHIETDRRTPAEEYYEREILNISDGLNDIGRPQWQIVLCLLFTWTLTFLALSKGIKSTGKAVIISTLFPYVVLLILFVRGITLQGSYEGILYYVTPKFDKLTDAKVWLDAAVQIFFAVSPAFGGMITLSSYNRFQNNFYADTFIVAFSNIGTSLFAGLVIFAIIGHLAIELDMDVDKVVDQGPGLAFIVYPDAVTHLPISPLWSILFFVMISTLGLGSEFGIMEVFMTAILDTFPSWRTKKTLILSISCIIGFICGLPLTCKAGLYLVQLMDYYIASWSIFIMASLESIIISWIYGGEKFIKDIETMIGTRSRVFHHYFKMFWGALTPASLMFVMIFNFIQYKPLKYDDYLYPKWANIAGILLSVTPLLVILVMGIRKVIKSKKDASTYENIKLLLKPTAEWGPVRIEPNSNDDNKDKA